MSDTRIEILDEIEQFDEKKWARFVRESLKLDDDFISQIESKPSTFTHKKYEMAQRWMKQNESENTIQRLVKLKEKFIPTKPKNVPAKTEPVPMPLSKGLALIICNKLNEESTVHEDDAESMEYLWKDLLGCDLLGGEPHLNKSADEMNRLIEEFSNSKTEHSYGVIVISSHGGLMSKSEMKIQYPNETIDESVPDPVQVIFDADQKHLIVERNMMHHFHNKAVWNGVPKFFILDYCRGKEKHKPKTLTKADPILEKLQTMCSQAVIPTISEFLAVYPTFGAYLAYADATVSPEDKDKAKGLSWLISAIREEFGENWKVKSVVEMLISVNKRMKDKIGRNDEKTMSVFESSLTMNFKLGN